MSIMAALKESASHEVDSLEHSIPSHSHSHSHHDQDVHENNALIPPTDTLRDHFTFTEKYHHVSPLSPTPVDSMGIDSTDSHQTLVQPLKGTSFLFLNHPTQSFSSKQLCDYIEMIVLRHVQSNEILFEMEPINTRKPLRPIQLIRGTLDQLRSLLVNDHLDLSIVIPKSNENNTKKFTFKHSPQNSNKNIKTSNGTNLKKGEPTTTPLKTPKWCTHSRRNIWDISLPSSALLHHPKYSINVDRYYGMLRGSVRQDWNTIETEGDEERNWEELKPHWFELFFDLMFVAAIVHISSEVADAYDHNDYGFIATVFPQFGLLILCWLEQVLYHSRFRMTQTKDGFARFVYMAFVLMMGLSIGNTNYYLSQKLFLIAYMFTKLIMCLMFSKSSLIDRAYTHSLYMIVENVLSIVAVIVIEIFVAQATQWIWIAIYCALFVYSWFHMAVLVYLQCIRDLGINIPINVPHIAERMGAFVLIILGETIISIMVQHVESTRNGILTAYTVTVTFFIIVYCIGKLYFESQPSEHELHHHKKSHAMSSSVWRARIYKWFHILLFFGLLGLGLGSKILVHELVHYHGSHEPFLVFMPGISCVVICVCINIIRLTHPFDYTRKHPHMVRGVWLVRVLCVLAMFGVLFSYESINHFVILAVYVACFAVQVFVDFEAKHRLIDAKSVKKNKSLEFYRSPRMKPFQYGKDEEHSHETLTKTEMSFIGTF